MRKKNLYLASGGEKGRKEVNRTTGSERRAKKSWKGAKEERGMKNGQRGKRKFCPFLTRSGMPFTFRILSLADECVAASSGCLLCVATTSGHCLCRIRMRNMRPRFRTSCPSISAVWRHTDCGSRRKERQKVCSQLFFPLRLREGAQLFFSPQPAFMLERCPATLGNIGKQREDRDDG